MQGAYTIRITITAPQYTRATIAPATKLMD